MTSTATHYYARTYAEQLATRLVCLARKRARKRGLPFDLTPADLTIPTVCPVLGLPLKLEPGPITDASATLDRIMPELGYVRGNVAVISNRANTLKSNASPEELAALLGYVRATLDRELKPRPPIESALASVAAPPRRCAECNRVLAPIRYPGDQRSPLCRSCAMRLAWATDEYRNAIMEARAKRRKRCAFCNLDGVGSRARYHPECWRKLSKSLRTPTHDSRGTSMAGGPRTCETGKNPVNLSVDE